MNDGTPTDPRRLSDEHLVAELRTLVTQSNAIPDGNLAAIVELAVTDFVERVKKQRFGVGRRPRPKPPAAEPLAPPSRHVPANVRTGAIVHVDAPTKNSTLFTDLVELVRRRYRRSATLHFILDNCIIHKSRHTSAHLARLGGRVVLHFLPPYSLESNVIERLWKQLHDHVTRNHRFASIDTLMDAVHGFLAAAQPLPACTRTPPAFRIASSMTTRFSALFQSESATLPVCSATPPSG